MTIFIADAGSGHASFGMLYGDITDHGTEDQVKTLCGREILTVLDIPFAEATNPCKRCLAAIQKGRKEES